VRQAGWGEVFVRRNEPLVLGEVPQEPRGWRRLFWWEDWLTFVLLGAMLLTVVASVQQAKWVDTMPSLYPIAFFGLLLGALLAGVRLPEPVAHLLALPIGAAASLGMILSNLTGSFPVDRYWGLHHRMAEWFHVAFHGGISNDDLPFIVLVVPLVWLSGYLSAWAVFRWNNAWAAIIPGGAVLLANMSFLPGGFSLAFVVFLVMASLLVTRLHLLERAKTWRAEQTPYPALLSLSVLHATFWLVIILLGAAWLLPSAGETSKFQSTWDGATQPLVQRVEGVSRLFVGVNNKKSVRVHDFKDILPLLGSIALPDTKVADVTLDKPLDGPLFLKSQSYDTYTSDGWLRTAGPFENLSAGEKTNLEQSLKQRQAISAQVVLKRPANEGLLSPGQPLSFDKPVRIQGATDSFDDIQRALPRNGTKSGDSYTATGTVSVATEDELRAATRNYPYWIEAAYLDLPKKLPQRVEGLANRVGGDEDNPYDQAVAIEQYLRKNYRFSLNVPKVPANRDAVDYFLFDSKEGYFDYHASAMVVLLRSLGVPSRLSVGYVLQGAEFDAKTGEYRVTEASAFTWPEVYFPGYGWLEFNPTPDYAAISRASAVDASEAPVLSGAANFGPGFVDPNAPEPGVDTPVSTAQDRGAMGRTAWIAIGLLAGFVVLLAGGAGGAHYAWTRGLADLDPPARLWGQTVRLASWTGLPPAQGQTPREYARTLSTRLPEIEGAEALAEGYVRHRYGLELPDATMATRLEEAWRSVRRRLLVRLVKRR
jgi:transglutaminase-like putative cysteine protease